jgi:hypothetical protein
MTDVRSDRSINWHMGRPDETGPFPTPMVERICRAQSKPIALVDAYEIRLLVSQDIALEYSLPMAIDILRQTPLVSAGHYDGDLLVACLGVKVEYWRESRSDHQRLRDLLANLKTNDKNINARIDDFLIMDVAQAGQKRRKTKSKGRAS